jgi:hypothetical protein
MASRPRRGPDVDQERNERRWSQDRDALTCWVGWWACQDLNWDLILIRVLSQGPFPQDRACNLRERPTAGDRWEPLGSDGVWTKRGPVARTANG